MNLIGNEKNKVSNFVLNSFFYYYYLSVDWKCLQKKTFMLFLQIAEKYVSKLKID